MNRLERWLRAEEAAQRLRVSSQTLANWRWAGKGPRWHKAGGRVLYDSDDVDAFVLGEDTPAA